LSFNKLTLEIQSHKLTNDCSMLKAQSKFMIINYFRLYGEFDLVLQS
jgi:hypothetical protein